MIKEFVERFDANRDKLREEFKKYHKVETYGDYTSDRWEIEYIDIVREVVKIVGTGDFSEMDYGNIHEIDDGDYQGTLLYVIPENCYQPDVYWYVMVDYGSCSGCDTLLAIIFGADDAERVLDDLMTLSLHIVQNLKKMEG